MRGFKTLKTVFATIKGFEVMRALCKGEAGWFAHQSGIVGEARIVERAFGPESCTLAEAMAVLQDHPVSAQTIGEHFPQPDHLTPSSGLQQSLCAAPDNRLSGTSFRNKNIAGLSGMKSREIRGVGAAPRGRRQRLDFRDRFSRSVAMSGMTFKLDTPHGRMMATMLAGIAQFESDLLSERVTSGLAAARARGKKLGRQPGQRHKSDRLAPKVLNAIDGGRSYRWIARDLAIGKNTVADIVKRHRANPLA